MIYTRLLLLIPLKTKFLLDIDLWKEIWKERFVKEKKRKANHVVNKIAPCILPAFCFVQWAFSSGFYLQNNTNNKTATSTA